MSRITSSVGLITGIPIEDTVNQLIQVAARPRNILQSRTDGLKNQQLAIDALGSRLLSLQFAINKFKTATVFQAREVVSSNADVVRATITPGGTATVGAYQVRSVQTAAAQQFVSQPLASATAPLGGGSLSLQFGGEVDRGVELSRLNAGAGVTRGKIRITDRSGAAAIIDLSYARTVDDVLQAINSASDIDVRASANGDSFQLSDHSGGSGNLRVQEVGGGTTAAGLGLAGINAAADQVEGLDVYRLHAGFKLAWLNDGNGVDLTKEGVVDLEVSLADGTELSIDLHDAATIGDVIERINAAGVGKLSAAIAADGRRLELTDSTAGAGEFRIANGVASAAADELGIAAAVTGESTVTGSRLVAGLRDSLLSRLRGGAGVGPLGDVAITDRNGASATVDLSGAETLSDVIAAINGAGVGVTASINAARNGIVVKDISGGSGNLIVADADSTNSAQALGLAVDDGVAEVNSGGLARQTMSRATLLSSLNGGQGVTLGSLRLTDGAGLSATAALNSFGAEARTVGDVIDAINALSIGVEARINDAGDGLLIVDTTGGGKPLAVRDVGGTVAKLLHLTRASKTIDVGGVPTAAIDGTSTHVIDLAALQADPAAIPLATLNAGKGVALGDVLISDSNGRTIALDLNGADAGITTVGQLIDLINAKGAAAPGGFSVTARINDGGSGILLEDAGGGPEKIVVQDVNSTTAADLKLTGAVTTVGGKQRINGSGLFSTGAATGLNALAARVNELQAGVTAHVFFDGQGHRLSLAVNATGSAHTMVVDSLGSVLQFEQTSQARDALLLQGDLSNPGASMLLSSADGRFDTAIAGLTLTAASASDTPATVTVRQTNTALVATMQEIVDAYNALRGDLGRLTAFDPDAATVGLLFGTNEALQIDSRLGQAVTSRYTGIGNFQTLNQLGVDVNADGTLSLNTARLQSAFENDPAGVQTFLTDPVHGVATKLAATIDRLAGNDQSLLAARSDSLKASIDSNTARITRFNEQLERQRERMFLQFTQLEAVIAKLQSNLSAIQNLQVLPTLSNLRR